MDLRVLIPTVTVLSQIVLSIDKRVYFSLVVSYGEYGFNSSGAIPAINIALEQIRSNTILPGYNLTYEVERNSQVIIPQVLCSRIIVFYFMLCSRTKSLDAFFSEIQASSLPKIAIIGCGCSPATEPVAEISHYWNISQV